MAQDIVGSHFAPDAFAGQNGDNTPSSLLPGRQVRRGKDANSIMKGTTDVSAKPGDWQTRTVDTSSIKVKPGMRSRNGEGGKIAAANVRASKTDGIARPLRR